MQDAELVSNLNTLQGLPRLDPVLRDVMPGGPTELEAQRMRAEAEQRHRLREGLQAELELFALQRRGAGQ